MGDRPLTVTEQARLSGAPDRPEEDMRVQGDTAHCWNCGRLFGQIINGNIYAGPLILVTKTPVRCELCKERNVWKPQR